MKPKQPPTPLMRLVGVLLSISLAVGFALWSYKNAAFYPSSINAVDLSDLFKAGPDETLDARDFLDLRDPACMKSFQLRLTQQAFIQMSHNFRYSMYVDNGQVSANFLNPTKGSIELTPGRTWSATDFWSIKPVTTNAYVRLEPFP